VNDVSKEEEYNLSSLHNPFDIPFECCPPGIVQAGLPSPTGCQSMEELEFLERKIDAVNQFLLDIGIRREDNQFGRERNQVLERALEGLTGQVAGFEIAGLSQNLEGRVHLAGRDFAIIRSEGNQFIIPYQNICFIKPANRFAEPDEGPRLLKIEPRLRRAIAFDFGRTVSSSPELIQLFFGLTLEIYLLLLEGKVAEMVTEDFKEKGLIKAVHREHLSFCFKETTRSIPLEEILYIRRKMKNACG
jgi:hypothetical protein